MPLFIDYIMKLAISLFVVWLFYRLVLQKLTFYNWNRFYLVGYSLVAFVIPFINISPVLKSNQLDDHSLVKIIPVVGAMETIETRSSTHTTEWVLFCFLAGCVVLVSRLIIQHVSLRRLKASAKLVLKAPVKLYEVDKDIIPFSYARSIFINPNQHTEEDIKKIIRHEFVHVKQRHSLDMLWAELLCILNWYNPFAWLIRSAIRQNLEFIADSHVVANGIEKKQYQYLLLKVMGNSQYSIATSFNFTSLKKRIAMMNKMRTARVHLIKFMFIVPLVAVMLLSFRDKLMPIQPALLTRESQESDTIPACAKPVFPKTVASFRAVDNLITVTLKDGTKETYNLNKADERAEFEKKYGKMPEPPTPPTPPEAPAAPSAPKLPDNIVTLDVNDNQATIRLKDGKVERYDLNNAAEKASFQKKYGNVLPAKPKAPVAPVTPTVASTVTVHDLEAVVTTNTNVTMPNVVTTTISADIIDIKPVVVTVGETEVELLVEISRETSIEELNNITKQLEEKGYTLTITNTAQKEGVLKSIDGTISDDKSKSRFMADDFSKISIYKVSYKGGKTGFTIRVHNGRMTVNQVK